MVCQGSLRLMIKCSNTLSLGECLIKHLGFSIVDAVRLIKPPFSPLRLIKNNHVISCKYQDPEFPSGFVFDATLLPGAEYVFCT